MNERFQKGLFIFLVLASIVTWVSILTGWRWRECRQVGHGVPYCIGEVTK